MAISGIGAGIPSPNYESNMHQVGGQSQLTNKKNITPTEADTSTESVAFDEVMLSGSDVDEAQDAFQNASHIGAFGAMAQEEDTEIGDDTQVPGQVGEDTEIPGEAGGEIDDGTEVPGDGGEVPPEGPEGPEGPDDPKGPEGPKENNGTDKTANAGKSQEEIQAEMKKAQEEQEAFNKFMTEMYAQHQKHMLELMKILMDTQNSIFEIINQAAANRAASQDRCIKMWNDVLFG